MKVMAINGSPRMAGNTAMMLENVLAGAAEEGAEVEMVNLYDLDFKGCISCFACKRKDSPGYGRCSYEDGLTPVLDRIREVDALVLGSPIYFGDVTGEMRSFVERLLFPYNAYDQHRSVLFPRKIRAGMVLTMNMAPPQAMDAGYDRLLRGFERLLGRMLGPTESVVAYDTQQFDDYSRYEASMFDPRRKAERRRSEYPKDLRKAFEMGKGLVRPMDR